jgi:hypothetical protein
MPKCQHPDFYKNGAEAGSLDNELKRGSKFELSWAVQFLKHILRKRTSLDRAALELQFRSGQARVTPAFGSHNRLIIFRVHKQSLIYIHLHRDHQLQQPQDVVVRFQSGKAESF